MDNIIISHINTSSPKYAGVWELREAILRIPLGLSLKNEDLSRDHSNTIFIAEHDDKIIGCVFLQPIDNEQVQLRAMAVYNEWQGKGVGRLLVISLEKFAAENGYNKIVLHARKVALGFYSNLGYLPSGDEFTEVGIPHYIMEKSINVAAI